MSNRSPSEATALWQAKDQNWGLKNENFGEHLQVCTVPKLTVFGKAEMEVDMKSLPKTNELNIFSALS